MIALTIYLLIATFFLGAYTGATFERGQRISIGDAFSLAWLSAFWPFLVVVFVYIWVKEKVE